MSTTLKNGYKYWDANQTERYKVNINRFNWAFVRMFYWTFSLSEFSGKRQRHMAEIVAFFLGRDISVAEHMVLLRPKDAFQSKTWKQIFLSYVLRWSQGYNYIFAWTNIFLKTSVLLQTNFYSIYSIYFKNWQTFH